MTCSGAVINRHRSGLILKIVNNMPIPAIIGGAFSIGNTFLNNELAKERTDYDRQQQYLYGEKQAEAADARTRALYSDFYSPQALMRQYKEAGLSPSMMFGGTPGQGGTAGAQGSNSGIQTPYMPISILEAAQVANLTAQTKNVEALTKKTNAETENVKIDTMRQEIAKGVEALQAGQYQNEWTILNSTWTENGKEKSIFEAARDHYSYESFLEWCRGKETNDTIKHATTTETGQKILREIYLGASRFHTEIMTLSTDAISAEFQADIVKAMQNEDFAKMNAKAAVSHLRQNISTSELTTEQKNAWNNLLHDIEAKHGSTTKDIIIILGMILNNGMSNWHMPNVNFNSTTKNNSFTTLKM